MSENTALNLTTAELDSVDKTLRHLDGDFRVEADSLLEGMPCQLRALTRAWLNLDPIKNAGVLSSAIEFPETTAGRGKEKRAVELPPRVSQDPTARAFAGIYRLSTAAGGDAWICGPGSIWEQATEQQLDQAVARFIEGLAAGFGVSVEIVAEFIVKVRKTALLHTGEKPETADGLIAFEDGRGWDISDLNNPVLRELTPADGVSRPVVGNAPWVIPDKIPQILTDWFPAGPDHDLAAKFFGCSVAGHNLGKSILILEGHSDAGKSALCEAFRASAWRHTGALRTSLLQERFELGGLSGFSVVIDRDASSDALQAKGAGIIKSITGNECVGVEEKNKNGQKEVHFSSHVILCSNYALYHEDSGDGMKNRIVRLILSPPAEKIVNFRHLWIDRVKDVFGGFLVRAAIDGRKEISGPTGHLILTEEQRSLVEELNGVAVGPLVSDFIRDTFKPSQLDKDKISISFLKGEFKLWAKRKKLDEKQIGKILPVLASAMYKAGFSRGSDNSGIKAARVKPEMDPF